MVAMHEGIGTVLINAHAELRALTVDKWIKCNEPKLTWTLQQKAIDLIDQVESGVKVMKKKASTQVLGDDYDEKISQYLSIFPKIKLPSKKYAWVHPKNLETAFKWFFENYKFDWDTILEATEKYVEEFRQNNYLYMQTSKYFIRKQEGTEKTFVSTLADYCNAVQTGEMDSETKKHFPIKVV